MNNTMKIKSIFNLNNDTTKIPISMFKVISDGSAFKTYCYLCKEYDVNKKYANPSIAKISRETRLSESTVKRAIKWLEEKQLIKKVSGSSECANKYFIYYLDDEINCITNEKDINNVCKDSEEIYVSFEDLYSKPLRKEISFLNDLEQVLLPLGIKGIRQYKVFNYRIDYYIPDLKIAIEYDENDHKGYSYEKQEGRQKKIEKELKCRFIRVSDKETNEENIKLITNIIL